VKYLLLFAILFVAYLLWRHARSADRGGEAPPKGPPAAGAPQDMIQCPVCSVHLPRGDAVAGADGLLYCSQEHRLRAER
jgi:uncharacterized protein